jgi:hypothetical protein
MLSHRRRSGAPLAKTAYAVLMLLLFGAEARAGSKPETPQKHAGHACISVTQAASQPNLNKDVCVSAHVFDVVELTDGTRFLDVCSAETPDAECRFTLLSLNADHQDVGDLRKYRDQEVEVRGIVRSTHGRMGIVISHMRQFNGGPEKFRPNPKLLREFNGQSDRMPVRDPNLASSGHHRSFMNTSDKEDLPAVQKH